MATGTILAATGLGLSAGSMAMQYQQQEEAEEARKKRRKRREQARQKKQKELRSEKRRQQERRDRRERSLARRANASGRKLLMEQDESAASEGTTSTLG